MAETQADRRSGIDPWLWGAVLFLVGFGFVATYSASVAVSERLLGASHVLALKQARMIAAGIGCMLFAAWMPRRWLQDRAGWWFVLALVGTALVLVSGFGHQVGGATRWLRLGPIRLQPSEFAKLAMVAWLAAWAAKIDREAVGARGQKLGPGFEHDKRLMVLALSVQPLVALVLLEPDFGTAVIMEAAVVMLLLAAGLRLRILLGLALLVLPAVVHLVLSAPYRLARVLAFLDPWAHRQDGAYQIVQSLVAIGSGGIFGLGLGASQQKRLFLPEAHTDFIFAIVAEETGFIGAGALVLAFGVLVAGLVRVALRAKDRFDAMVVLGVLALVALPATLNLGVTTGLLPTTGITLPLVSYGGSSMVSTLMGLGWVLRIDHQSRQQRIGA